MWIAIHFWRWQTLSVVSKHRSAWRNCQNCRFHRWWTIWKTLTPIFSISCCRCFAETKRNAEAAHHHQQFKIVVDEVAKPIGSRIFVVNSHKHFTYFTECKITNLETNAQYLHLGIFAPFSNHRPRLFHLKTPKLLPKNAYFIAKFLKFADGDAEAPLSVFLFIYY